ncbi:protein Abitram [Trichonephila clavipes]|nr:protein Abitram [Trichonephila clavipes]
MSREKSGSEVVLYHVLKELTLPTGLCFPASREGAGGRSINRRKFYCKLLDSFPDGFEMERRHNVCVSHKPSGIPPTHPILKENLDVISINFDPVGKVNRLSNKVSGKFKKGGQKLSEKSVLCTVKCSNDCEYTIYSCISGSLVEVNERLVENPKLLKENPWSEGYIVNNHSPPGVLPQNWGRNEPNRTVTCMVLKATANDRRHLVLCHDEYRGPRSGLCRSVNTPTQIKDQLDSVYGNSAPSFTTVKFRAAEFKRSRKSLGDERSGSPNTAATDENIDTFQQMALDDCR